MGTHDQETVAFFKVHHHHSFQCHHDHRFQLISSTFETSISLHPYLFICLKGTGVECVAVAREVAACFVQDDDWTDGTDDGNDDGNYFEMDEQC